MLSNFHTHTRFCDGHDSPEEMAEKALSLGFKALGFSGHSYTDFDPCGMTPDSESAYRAEIARLKEEYAGRIELYCGVEQDYYSGRAPDCYDYVIGSVHYVRENRDYLCVDWSAEETERIVREVFGGDAYAFARRYYENVARVQAVTGCGIIGHFDLITKFDESGAMFDENHTRYRSAVGGALDALCPQRPVFEINTGAIARGYRKTPFPSPGILRELRRRGCPIMLNTDCHDREKLDCGYEAARQAARDAGFTSRIVIKNGKFCEIGL